jgi:hypothetical protein
MLMKRCAAWRSIAIVFAPLTLSAQSLAPDASVYALAGCYSLSLGRWSGPLAQTGLSGAQTPPAQFRLDTTQLDARRGPGYVVEPEQLAPSTRSLTAWRPLSDNTVRVAWSTGFVGVSLFMQVRGDTLVGTATPFWDNHMVGEPPPPTANVTAVRVPCARR